MNTRAGRTGGRGFTLFEMVLVLLIIGISAAVIVPEVGNNIRSPRLRTAANVLMSDIEFCQSECIGQPGSPRAITFNTVANSYTMVAVNGQANSSQSMLAAGVGAAAVMLTVADGSSFPTANFKVAVESEVMTCTARVGNLLTVLRGQSSTTAAAHSAGVAVIATVTTVASGTTVNHPMDGQPYVNDFATGRNAQLNGVTITGLVMGAGTLTTLTFDAYGRPLTTADFVITLSYKGQTLTVTVKSGTGDVSISG